MITTKVSLVMKKNKNIKVIIAVTIKQMLGQSNKILMTYQVLMIMLINLRLLKKCILELTNLVVKK